MEGLKSPLLELSDSFGNFAVTINKSETIFLRLVPFQGLFSRAFDLEARDFIDENGAVDRKQSWLVLFIILFFNSSIKPFHATGLFLYSLRNTRKP